jgi:hypothetical protein
MRLRSPQNIKGPEREGRKERRLSRKVTFSASDCGPYTEVSDQEREGAEVRATLIVT